MARAGSGAWLLTFAAIAVAAGTASLGWRRVWALSPNAVNYAAAAHALAEGWWRPSSTRTFSRAPRHRSPRSTSSRRYSRSWIAEAPPHELYRVIPPSSGSPRWDAPPPLGRL